ncbi:MAG TPA: maltose alpha-D-glucosyltransferase [Chloroflexota bacterium]|nr:maltose alpha-D-glucosyltransferase [Chloroflexota bacterium]
MIQSDRLWYKDAVFYEVPVHAFHDGNGDGVGDFRGLKKKLGYLRDLGVDCLWLLPFYPSPMRDGGYDVSDFFQIHPDYGTLEDFGDFIKSAHQYGIRVIGDLVLNHTSDQHPWFQESRRSPDSPKRDWYVWSDDPSKYKEARIIFCDLEPSNWTWDPDAKAYYWHRFFSHQPDLTYDNPEVRVAMKDVVRYWLGMGLDGFRCDAVSYLFEREGTSCESLPETHAYLRELREMVDREFPGCIMLAEANQQPSALCEYFGDCNEFHMAFHFPLMPRVFLAMAQESCEPIVNILGETPEIPDGAQWGIFLRNHDELTLEMVSEEEREHLYREYVLDPRMRLNEGIRRRLAPLLSNDRRQLELVHAMLFSMQGSPILYYGDEIGMGDNVYLGDRNGVRTPMQWSARQNAGFSSADPESYYLPLVDDPCYCCQEVNVEAQQASPHSLLSWMRRMIGIRRQLPAMGRGSMEILPTGNSKLLAYLRQYRDQTVLAVNNLSNHPQQCELDLRRFQGYLPVDVLQKKGSLLTIGNAPTSMALGPLQYCWFVLEPQSAA